MKNIFAVVVLISSAVFAHEKLSSKQVVDEISGPKSFKVNSAALEASWLSDGGSVLTATCFRSATISKKDGGTAQVDLGGGDCKFSKANEAAVLKALSDSSDP